MMNPCLCMDGRFEEFRFILKIYHYKMLDNKGLSGYHQAHG